MADLNDLATFMDRLNAASSNYIGRFASDVAVQAALAVIEDLTLTTPVDTGTAVSNWQVTLESPSEAVLPAFAPSPKGHKVKGVWVHKIDPLVTLGNNAPSVIEAAKLQLQSKQPGQPIYITNNLEYIQELNQGSSDQSPAGFVERAEIIAEQIAANAVMPTRLNI